VNNGERRVVVTGVGAVTPIGTGVDGLWAGLGARTSAVREITRFDPTRFRSRIAAEIPDFRPHDHLDAKRAKRLDRFSQLAVTSARLALGRFRAFSATARAGSTPRWRWRCFPAPRAATSPSSSGSPARTRPMR
jgi:3-oxoacyl-(acyl-carrier-protein) synthase